MITKEEAVKIQHNTTAAFWKLAKEFKKASDTYENSIQSGKGVKDAALATMNAGQALYSFFEDEPEGYGQLKDYVFRTYPELRELAQ